MIVQRVPQGATPVIIRNVDHAVTVAQLARTFGNDRFAMPEPAALMAFIARHHEEGWRPLDNAPLRNPATGLPYHLGETPPALLVQKSVASPDFNQAYHPWCGVLSSMHSWGLYNRRYGISDAVSIEAQPASHADQITAMLDGERARQDRLKTILRADAATAPWAEVAALFTAYKLLEFFDTLALWWQLSHPSLRQPAIFRHVPAAPGNDLTLEITPTGPNSARLSPYPFTRTPLWLRCRARWLCPVAQDCAFGDAIAVGAAHWQHYRLSAR